jgi:hypothetical protein
LVEQQTFNLRVAGSSPAGDTQNKEEQMENLSTTCRDLWNDWRKEDPNGFLVQQASNAIKNYTKDDWDAMSLEATDIMSKLSALSKNNTNVEQTEARDIFFELLSHVERWFFMPTKEYVDRIAFALSFDSRYKSFFNKYEPNLSKYMIKLIEKHKEEI